jgi:hypothetical protein
MKAAHFLILIGTVSVFLLSFVASQGIPTGLVTFEQALSLQVEDSTSETGAAISWRTNKDTVSVLDINGKQTAFGAAKQFRKEITGLQENSAYEYTVRACTANECKEKISRLTTSGHTNAITGAVVGRDIIQTAQTGISLVVYSLIATIALLVTGRIGYEQLSNRNPVGDMMKKSTNFLQNDQYGDAHDMYKKAAQAFTKLEDAARLKHYNSMLRLYHNLKRYAEVKEAQRLAEKYEQRTISQDEMSRLSKLMEE